MSRNLGLAAFLLGLCVVAWVGSGYLGSNALALTMTALIGAFYLAGGLELQRFHRATSSLRSALEAMPHAVPNLGGWLGQLPPSLQNPVRLRIEGERIGLPGPAMTPYLVGLLVVLGMLGTFLGMVVTLKGAVMALESTTDLATIRAALAAPVKGLGLAFGTSVAGVAASAMLGLVSALCRRERLDSAQLLDTRIATTLRVYSLAHQRQITLETLQVQGRAMPELLGQMQSMMAQMERHSHQTNERQLASQERFHGDARSVYSELAASVERSLREALTEGARAAGATLQPAVEATMAAIALETATFQQRMADSVQAQLDGVAGRFDTAVHSVAKVWADSLDQHQRSSEALSARLQADTAASDEQRLVAWSGSLESMAQSLRRESQQASEQALGQQAQICRTLEQTAHDMHAQAEVHARNTIAEMSRLIEAASDAPRAAAEVVALLRQKLSDSMVRDNDLLDERARIMATLGSLLDTVSRAAAEQRGAIDALVASAASLLERAGTQFGDRVEAGSARIVDAAAQVTGSAIDVASLGEAFGAAVQMFSASSEALTVHLQRIEAALDKSTGRSDEQLAYYVAQAREIIDLSISSQKQIVEDLQQLALRPQPRAGVAA
jgi:hypothetical protein